MTASSAALYVCSLSDIHTLAQDTGASHLLSVLSADTPVTRPAGIAADHHMYLEFNDITAPTDGLVPPGRDHIEAILDFGRSWDRKAPMIVHCWAGVSRSTAAGYILSLALSAAGEPHATARLLRARAPWATPNARMVALADGVMGAGGEMRAAIEAIGRGAHAYEGRPFQLPVDAG